MKRLYIYICAVILIVMNMFTNAMAAENAQTIRVFLNGEIITFSGQQPEVVERRTLIPLRGIFEKMGYGIEWNADLKTATISNKVQTIVVRSGHKGMKVNNNDTLLDVPAQIIEGSLMVPLRAVVESTGATITWDAPTKTIYVNASEKEQVTYEYKSFLSEYSEAISELDTANKFFKTLNSLTDRNYNKKFEQLKRECSNAREALLNVKENILGLNPSEEFEKLCDLSVQSVEIGIDLCNLADDMLDDKITYDEATEHIATFNQKANAINMELSNAMSGYNLGLYR